MALPTSPPATAPITAPPTGLKPAFLAMRPPVMPPATAPIPVPACWREPGAPQPATQPLTAMIRTKAPIQDRDVIMTTPPQLWRSLTGKCRGDCAALHPQPADIAALRPTQDAPRHWSARRAQDRHCSRN